MVTSPRDDLLDFFRPSRATPGAKALLLKRTFQEFVLEYGRWYEPVEMDGEFTAGTPQQCQTNSLDLVLDVSLTYCEGYALFESGGIRRSTPG